MKQLGFIGISNKIFIIASLGLLFFVGHRAGAQVYTEVEIGGKVQTIQFADSSSTPEPVVLGESVELVEVAEEGVSIINSGDLEKVSETKEVELIDGIKPTDFDENEYIVHDPTDAVELKRLFLDSDTIIKGYTVTSLRDDFKAGIVAGAVRVPVTVVLKQIPGWHIPVDKTSQKVSGIFDVDVRACKGDKDDCKFSETTSLGSLEKPIVVAIKFNSQNYRKKVIHYWYKPTQEWRSLESTTDFDSNLVRAELFVPYARLAVFEDLYVQEGKASWYHQFDGHYAASQSYKRGTMLKVTNISGSVRHGNFEIVKVNDYGPAPGIHKDRPIDLDSHVYKHLAVTLGSGLMMVRVEPLEKDPSIKYSWVLEAEAAERDNKLVKN